MPDSRLQGVGLSAISGKTTPRNNPALSVPNDDGFGPEGEGTLGGIHMQAQGGDHRREAKPNLPLFQLCSVEVLEEVGEVPDVFGSVFALASCLLGLSNHGPYRLST